MPSLLDQVLTNKDNPTADSLLFPAGDKPHKLSDGSQIYDSTIAAINRILELNPYLHKRPTGTISRPYQMYNGHTPVDLTDKRTFLSLVRADFVPKTPFQTVLICTFVEKYVPTFSRGKVVVSEGLIWDSATGELDYYDKNDNVRTVS